MNVQHGSVTFSVRLVGICEESQKTALAEDDDPFKELQDEIDSLQLTNQILFQKVLMLQHFCYGYCHCQA